MPSGKTADFGKYNEDLACKLIEEKGYTIIERNYRYGNRGEIDIVAEDGDILVFIEVKARKTDEFGPAEIAVTKNKQKQIKKMASLFLFEKEISNRICRIDVIAVNYPDGKPILNHIVNAF